jgi:hypothetical protein
MHEHIRVVEVEDVVTKWWSEEEGRRGRAFCASTVIGRPSRLQRRGRRLLLPHCVR